MPDNIGLAVITYFMFLKVATFMPELVAPKMVLLINHTLSCFLYSYTRLRTSSHGNQWGFYWSWLVYGNGEVGTSSGYGLDRQLSVVLTEQLRTSHTYYHAWRVTDGGQPYYIGDMFENFRAYSVVLAINNSG